jgi:hypothetical protein
MPSKYGGGRRATLSGLEAECDRHLPPFRRFLSGCGLARKSYLGSSCKIWRRTLLKGNLLCETPASRKMRGVLCPSNLRFPFK